MKKKLTILFSAVFVVALCAFGFFGYMPAEAASDKTVSYEYKLLGDTYSVDGLVSATDPKGNDIPLSQGDITLNWASGSYVFEYASKIVKVKVYEEMPEDKIVYEFPIETSVKSGVEITFPTATISSQIVRIDGAPKIGDYSYTVEVLKNGKAVHTINPSKDNLIYEFSVGGEYVLSYVYTNCFEKQVSFDTSVTVTDEKAIKTSLSNKIALYEEISSSDFYGSFMGEKYAVSLNVKNAEGQVIATDKYRFTESGNYTAAVSSEIDGETITREFNLEVAPSVSSFIAEADGVKGIDEINSLSSCITTADKMLAISVGPNSSFYYKGVINLNDYTKNDKLISIFPNSLPGSVGVSQIVVSLIDVYDSENVLKINFSKNSNRNGAVADYDNSFTNVSYGSVTSAVQNYGNKKDTSVAWNSTFYSYWASPEFSDKNAAKVNKYSSLNFSLDVKGNTVYSCADYHFINVEGSSLSGVTFYPILNMNDGNLAERFKGFTTGEVYMKVDVTGAGDIAIESIAGKSIASVSADDYITSDGILTGENDYTVEGVVNTLYPLSHAVSGKFNSHAAECVVKDPSGAAVDMTEKGFIPKVSGTYTLAYTAENEFGVSVTKTYKIKVAATATPMFITYSLPKELDAGTTLKINKPVIIGGNGKISYEIYFNGEKVSVGDIFRITDKAEITVKATDLLGFTETANFNADVNTEVIESDVIFPKSAPCSSRFILPSGNIHYYKTGENIEYEVYANGELIENDYIMLPDEPTVMNIEYRTAVGSVYYKLNVINKQVDDINEFLSLDGTAEITSAGIYATVKQGSKISFPYAMSAEELNATLYILESELNFDVIEFILTGENGQTLKFSIEDLKAVKSKVYVNGVDTGKTMQKISNTGNRNMPPKFVGKTYYSYSIAYDDNYGGILVNGKPFVKIEYTADGFPFDGFGGGVYLDIVAGASGEENASLCINTVSNQKLITIAFENGDVVAPKLYANNLAKNTIVEYGDIIDFSGIKAYDVLSGYGEVKLSLIMPDGTVLFKDVKAADVGKVKFAVYGNYRLTMTATDVNGQSDSALYIYTVEDLVDPELSLEKTDDITAKVGSTVSLYDATAKDNYSTCNIRVVAYAPDGTVKVLASGKEIKNISFTPMVKGTYRIRYFATDENDNVVSVSFTVNAQ